MNSPPGILIEPISGLSLAGFSGGVEFFKSLPAVTEPDDLDRPEFTPSLTKPTSSDVWLAAVKQQVVDQYSALKDNPGQSGFLAAFTEPMLIQAGAKLITTYVPEAVMHANVQVQLSTDGKIALSGDMVFLSGLFTIPVRLYADLSRVGEGSVVMLFMAKNIPVGQIPNPPFFLGLMNIDGKF